MKVQFRDELLKCIQNYPILYVPHHHQKFICEEIQNACKLLFAPMGNEMFSNTIECSHKELEDSNSISQSDFQVGYIVNKLARHISFVKEVSDYSAYICIIKDVDSTLLNDARFVSLIHEFVEYYETRCKLSPYNCLTIVLCVPSCEMPPSCISSISYVINIKPPSEQEIRNELIRYGLYCRADTNDETLYVRALQGLHLYDIRQIMQSTKNTYGKLIVPSSVTWAQNEKQQLVRKTGVLDVVEPDVTLDDVGGLSPLKEAIESAARLFKNINLLQEANIVLPKGYLLLGMPGCGKSMIAKATANKFGCPLLRFDMGKLLGKYVGDSEHNLQLALDVVDSAHPCVLWIDEIEKAFAGTNNTSGDGDSLILRLMGKFLSWMQERTTAVFIVATANDVLKPELMRKGRFDEVYFVDFPTAKEAEEIIKKTLEKYNLPKSSATGKLFGIFDDIYIEKIARIMTNVADSHHGLSGAEIKAYLNDIIAKKISSLINKTEHENNILQNGILLSEDEFEKQLSVALESAMINQWSVINSRKESGKTKSGERVSFIDKIYCFKDMYNFKSASEDL